MLLNVTIVGISFVNLMLRRDGMIEHYLPSGLILSCIAAGLLMVTGYFGGELVFRYRVGISDRPKK